MEKKIQFISIKKFLMDLGKTQLKILSFVQKDFKFHLKKNIDLSKNSFFTMLYGIIV